MRQTAADNLGRLSAMSVRIDTLANDLVRNAQETAPNLKESYLTALRGVLASSGQRLSPATLASAGSALESILQSAGSQQTLSVAAPAFWPCPNMGPILA